MAAPTSFVVRGTQGLWMVNGPPGAVAEHPHFPQSFSPRCRAMAFSEDGSLLAYCDGASVTVIETDTFKIVLQLDKSRTAGLHISPRKTYLATWEPYVTQTQGTAGPPNMSIWDLKSGKLLHSLIQKRPQSWNPQWNADESICSRLVNNEVHFHENSNFETWNKRLQLQKLSDFKMADKCSGPAKVAVYIAGAKGQPCFVRLFQYPNFGGNDTALASKSFFKADRGDLYWNNKGTAVLVMTVAEAATTDSYYGEQGLHYLDIKGESCFVPRAKNGPIYSVQWNPNSTDFCVVYGSMPAKATLYNLKCEPIFDFGTGPRNVVHYNPFGNILCLAGFGNLHGYVEMWHLNGPQNTCLLSKFKAPDTTYFEWSPDGMHILTATTSPRLRVGNGYKVFHYNGQMLGSYDCPSNQELWEVAWRPAPPGKYPVPRVEVKSAGAVAKQVQEEKPMAYVPPGRRNQSGGAAPHQSVFTKEYEPPSNLKEQQQSAGETKSRGQKKREAQKRAKEARESGEAPSPPSAPSADQEVDPSKKIKAIKKKLQQIAKLKEQQAAGNKLEVSQLEKIKQEAALVEELQQLRL